MTLDNEKLLNIYGGTELNYSFLNAISKMISTVLELGRAFGSALRRAKDRNYCK